MANTRLVQGTLVGACVCLVVATAMTVAQISNMTDPSSVHLAPIQAQPAAQPAAPAGRPRAAPAAAPAAGPAGRPAAAAPARPAAPAAAAGPGAARWNGPEDISDEEALAAVPEQGRGHITPEQLVLLKRQRWEQYQKERAGGTTGRR